MIRPSELIENFCSKNSLMEGSPLCKCLPTQLYCQTDNTRDGKCGHCGILFRSGEDRIVFSICIPCKCVKRRLHILLVKTHNKCVDFCYKGNDCERYCAYVSDLSDILQGKIRLYCLAAHPVILYQCKQCYQNVSNVATCGECRKVVYCSLECQKIDWPTHKITCGTLKNVYDVLLEWDTTMCPCYTPKQAYLFKRSLSTKCNALHCENKQSPDIFLMTLIPCSVPNADKSNLHSIKLIYCSDNCRSKDSDY